MLAAFESRAVCTTMAGPEVFKSKFNLSILISVCCCSQFSVPLYSNQFLIFGFEFLIVYLFKRCSLKKMLSALLESTFSFYTLAFLGKFL